MSFTGPKNDQAAAWARDLMQGMSDYELSCMWDCAIDHLTRCRAIADVLEPTPEASSAAEALGGLVSIALYAMYQERMRREQ